MKFILVVHTSLLDSLQCCFFFKSHANWIYLPIATEISITTKQQSSALEHWKIQSCCSLYSFLIFKHLKSLTWQRGREGEREGSPGAQPQTLGTTAGPRQHTSSLLCSGVIRKWPSSCHRAVTALQNNKPWWLVGGFFQSRRRKEHRLSCPSFANPKVARCLLSRAPRTRDSGSVYNAASEAAPKPQHSLPRCSTQNMAVSSSD